MEGQSLDNSDVVFLNKKQRISQPPPKIDGELTITVHIISVNQQSTAFAKTRRQIEIIIQGAAKYLLHYSTVDPNLNDHLPKVDASILHELVINYFGNAARSMVEKIKVGAETQALIDVKNTNNPKYDVSYFEAIILKQTQLF